MDNTTLIASGYDFGEVAAESVADVLAAGATSEALSAFLVAALAGFMARAESLMKDPTPAEPA
jgi:hypothetical protein